ncbi:MAG TPA: hypothetical protein IGS40_17275 [Trichormus sp. M33_DOE_039]|nr:hypothetical protein [Trichormus sp. M33_DOE_039]
MKNSESSDHSLYQESRTWKIESGEDITPSLPCQKDAETPKTRLILHLIPVIGFFPSLWAIYHHQGNREQLAISRLSMTLAFTWLLSYLLLATGAATSDFLALRMLILNSFFTSGYFLVSIWLIFRIIRGKSFRLPGLSNLAEKLFDN